MARKIQLLNNLLFLHFKYKANSVKKRTRTNKKVLEEINEKIKKIKKVQKNY